MNDQSGSAGLPVEMALDGTHDFVIEFLQRLADPLEGQVVLDIGAGQGALSARLREAGLAVAACDVIADQFRVPDVECRSIDPTGKLPFESASFDVAVAVEVLEHVDGHGRFFEEAARVLKPDGLLLFTTPNILSLKSRMRFLLTGTYYSFPPLEPFTTDPIRQHISPLTLNRYAWMLSQHGLHLRSVESDRYQNTSRLLGILAPFVRLATRATYGQDPSAHAQNASTVLYGRTLLIAARKSPPPEADLP